MECSVNFSWTKTRLCRGWHRCVFLSGLPYSGYSLTYTCATTDTHSSAHTLIHTHTPRDDDLPLFTILLSHHVLREVPERASGWIGALRPHRISFLTFSSPFSWGLSVPSLFLTAAIYSSFLWVFVQPVTLPVPLCFWLPVLRGFPFPLKKMSPFIARYGQCALKQ